MKMFLQIAADQNVHIELFRLELVEVMRTDRKLSLRNTYMANMLRGFGPCPGRLHQATPLTREGCLRLCRQRQPEPESESGLAHNFTVSSLAQVSKIRPVGFHFILEIDSCGCNTQRDSVQRNKKQINLYSCGTSLPCVHR